MTDPTRALERLPVRPTLVGLAGAIAVCLAATAVADPVGDAGLLGAAAAFLLAGAAFFLWRRHLDTLPLEFAEPALRGSHGALPAYRFRVRLGRGRPMLRARARIAFRPDDGPPVALSPTLPEIRRAVGPWTLVVVDDGTIGRRPGRFEVDVEAVSRGRTWRASRTWHTRELRDGRFGADLTVRDGALVVDPARWDAVLADAPP